MFCKNFVYLAVCMTLATRTSNPELVPLSISSKITGVFCYIWEKQYRLFAPLDPNKFENCSTRTQEVALRILIASCDLIALGITITNPLSVITAGSFLFITSKIFRALGFALQKNGFSHIQTKAIEESLPNNPKFMTWNICGAASITPPLGGVIRWQKRVDRIVEVTKAEDPGICFYQEVYDTALTEAFTKKHQNSYAHIYAHHGPCVMGSVNGYIILSKYPEYSATFIPFTNADWSMYRGFFILELKETKESTTPSLRIVGTHLSYNNHYKNPKKEAAEQEIKAEVRKEQIDQIVAEIKKREKQHSILTIFMGDFNLERDSKEGEYLAKFFTLGYTDTQPTCTNRLIYQWNNDKKNQSDRWVDYICTYKKPNTESPIENCHIVQKTVIDPITSTCHQEEAAFNPKTLDTKTALSDHQPIVANVRFTRDSKAVKTNF